MIEFEMPGPEEKADLEAKAEKMKAIIDSVREHVPPQLMHDLQELVAQIALRALDAQNKLGMLGMVLEVLVKSKNTHEKDRSRLDTLAEYGAHTIEFISRDSLRLKPGQTLRAGIDGLIESVKNMDKVKH